MVAYFCGEPGQRGQSGLHSWGFQPEGHDRPWQNPTTPSRDARETLPRSRSRKRSAGAKPALPIPLPVLPSKLRPPIRSLRPFPRNPPTTLQPPEPGVSAPGDFRRIGVSWRSFNAKEYDHGQPRQTAQGTEETEAAEEARCEAPTCLNRQPPFHARCAARPLLSPPSSRAATERAATAG